MNIKKYIYIIISLISISCHSQTKNVLFEVNKNINDTLPFKILLYPKSEKNGRINVIMYVMNAVVIKNNYDIPVNIDVIQFSDSSLDNDLLGGTSVFLITKSNLIGRPVLDINQTIPAKDSIVFKYAIDYFFPISIREKDYLMKEAKFSQMIHNKEAYDVGKNKDFHEFLNKHIPSNRRGAVYISITNPENRSFITSIQTPVKF